MIQNDLSRCITVGSVAVLLMFSVATAETPRAEAECWVDRGLALNDNSEEEADYYREAIRLDPTYAAAHFNLGYVLQKREHYREALVAYQACIEQDPARSNAFLNAGNIAWLITRDPEEARPYLNRYVELERGSGLDDEARIYEVEGTIRELERSIAREKAFSMKACYTSEEIIEILLRPITRQERGGSPLYSAGRVPMLLFRDGSAVLHERAPQQLHEMAKALRDPRLEGIAIVIEGHTDARGDSIANHLLSARRARRVFTYLTTHGAIPPERLSVRYYGEDRPVAVNGTLKGMLVNNRLEINHEAACWE